MKKAQRKAHKIGNQARKAAIVEACKNAAPEDKHKFHGMLNGFQNGKHTV